MKNNDVINSVVEQTGVPVEECNIILKSFEEKTQDALVDKFKGKTNDKEDIVNRIHQDTNIDLNTCRKVVNALEEVLDTKLTNKLKFFKK